MYKRRKIARKKHRKAKIRREAKKKAAIQAGLAAKKKPTPKTTKASKP